MGARQRGAFRDLPCRRAPFLLKKVLPGQMGGPDVLKQKRNQHKGQLIGTHSPTLRTPLSPNVSLRMAPKYFPNYALFIPSENASLKTISFVL